MTVALIVICALWTLSTILTLLGTLFLYRGQRLGEIGVYTRADLALTIGCAFTPILQWVVMSEIYSFDARAWKEWWSTGL